MTELDSRLAAALEGRYRIEGVLGAGGMATVYLAHDERHGRHVALKVLKPELAAVVGAERFLAEIRTTANLQHPHILPLFDSGAASGLVFYVMPHVRGESLADRLARERQLPVEEAVGLAVKILAALQYAHDQGIVHRDIKPANILLANGEPLVADFGIALAASQAGGGRITETGLSLGTPHYMSPEQATGAREIDPRSDLYSVGAVIYEMLAGRPPHEAASAQAVLARILTEDAPRLSAERSTVPPNVDASVRRAMQRLPADRFASARDFAEALQDPAFGADEAVSGRRGRGLWPWIAGAGWALALALLASWGLGGWDRAPFPVEAPVPVRFTVEAAGAGSVNTFGTIAVSPDGQTIAFTAAEAGLDQIQLRTLDRPGAVPLEGTTGGRGAFFSPDGRRLGFFTEAGLKSVELTTGDVRTLSESEEIGSFLAQGVELDDGWILARHDENEDLLGLPPDRSEIVQLLVPDSLATVEAIGLPSGWSALPGGRVMLALQRADGTWPAVFSPSEGTLDVWTVPGRPLHAWDAHVLISSDGGLLLARLDPSDGSLNGTPRLLLEAGEWAGRLGEVVVFHHRMLFSWAGQEEESRRLVWLSPEGNAEALPLPPGAYDWPRLSPDDRTLLVDAGDAQLVIDLATGARTPLSGGGEHDWGPDGEFVYFGLGPEESTLLRQRADGSAGAEVLVDDTGALPWVTSISPDGGTLLFYRNAIEALDLETGEIRTVIDGQGRERNAEFSPDGRYVAYSASLADHSEVYVTPWPATDRRWTVSSGGGALPIWSRGGEELYYVNGDRMMSVALFRGGVFEPARPEVLFQASFYTQINGDQSYDVARDGRFIMIQGEGDAAIDVLVGWLEPLLEAEQPAVR